LDDLGEVVGGSGSFAVLWQSDPVHTVESLGALSGQGWSSAFGINDVGQVVGWSGFTAFLWTRENGMQDLNSLIPSNSGWSLSLATAINVRGQITGQGTINGQQHGFLLTPVSE
jgi:probable HAF family extracellular repeat protein